ncbi:bifunctional 3-hexulose-6-phosphate synthase/6-phospho-3-hexuloisomerase [Methylomicrobium sp. Wu6]|uniref:bifunctional 3-hexulose-6-phosphate synthase/6-phospho-3-hexuloisomerase n=1 Tax=Methylomicrobium sp. Wu6 TaxID=3107928 RepID=UPI002DD69F72|nr:bifunctional 3-hexulose-6-phosphate synthase/6-phospho-3-hexuloisomerase [Methylomicrobium sp. Wu6]MEC4750638.1 bifunctional 3-hexulose-6-phosphate synthase/6-phospho-3-hexuloisomerase [Methylomicrobium sp. Wu6]
MAKPLIQLALDSLDFDQTINLAEKTAPYVDIFEIGTPCIKHNGVELVKTLREKFPDKLILVDLKTMDAGEYEATPFYAAGADICTVLGVSGMATIAGVIKAANAYGGEAQIDLINVPDKQACARAAAELGAQIIGVHTGLDAQAAGQTPFADLQDIADLGLNIRISVAGGIKPSTVDQVVKAGADIIVVGAAIYGAPCPATAAKQIRDIVHGTGIIGTPHQTLIINKIRSILEATDDNLPAKLTHMLDNAKRVYVSGAGRSGLVCRFFAMRLMHSGYDVSVVGEIVTPSIKKGDLLIVISGSGETEQLIAFTKKAREVGAQICLITAKSGSTIGEMSDAVFQIGTSDQYGKVVGMPMGTVFELSTLSFLEALVSHLIHEKGIAEEVMRYRHANLE